MEKTLIILKPDAVQRGLIGELIRRFEAKGLRLVGMKMMQITPETAAQHYAEHEGKPFYHGLIQFITSSPVVVLAIGGAEAISVCRKLIGATNGRQAEPGTIRGDLGLSPGYNLIHGSDSPESAQREQQLFFEPHELHDYQPTREQWSYDDSDA